MPSIGEKCSVFCGILIGISGCIELDKCCSPYKPSSFAGGFFYGFGFAFLCIVTIIIIASLADVVYLLASDCCHSAVQP